MDLSLDDIIKLKKQTKPNRRFRNSKPLTNNPSRSKLDLQRLKELGARSGIINKKTSNADHQRSGPTSNKLQISNLHAGVSDKDIWDLFQDIGALKKASVLRDGIGRSLCTAEVVYEDPKHVAQAINMYHLRALDGKPMNVTIVPSNSSNMGPSLLSRLGIKDVSGIQRQKISKSAKERSQKNNKSAWSQSEVLSIEELDADIEAYRRSRNCQS